MKVVAYVHKYPPEHNAGAEMMLHAMLRDLVRRGHEALVYGAHLRARHNLDGVRAIPRTSARFLEREVAGADVIVTHLDETRRAIDFARRHGLPVVHLLHNDRQVDYHAIKPTDAALVVSNSAWIADTIGPGLRPKTIIVRPPVDPAEYRTTPGDRVTLLNLAPAKGGPLFFELAGMLPNVGFLGVRGAYASQAIPKRVPPNVELLDNRPDVVEAVYSRTKLLLVPSSYESFGRVAIEASSSGIPVLAHPTEGLRESLGDAGVFLDRAKPKLWRDAIVELLEDPDRYAELGARGRARADELAEESRRELDVFAEKLEELAREKVTLGDLPARPLDFVALTRAYLEHLRPVWEALPEEHRGTFYVSEWLLEEAADLPGTVTTIGEKEKLEPGPGIAVVASYHDLVRTWARRAVLFEHGAGQSYTKRHSSYAGGVNRKNVDLFVVPGPEPAKRNRRYYPKVPNVEVGSPKLDPWLAGDRTGPGPDDPPTVALSFHWRCNVAPEAGTVVDHYLPGLEAVVAELEDQGVTVLGHAHPGILEELRPHYDRLGVEVVDLFDEVLERAHVYAVDNSSTLFEFAATGRPVVVLNGPAFRKNVRHGLRFWKEADVGRQVEGPAELAGALLEALDDPPELRALREAAIARVYARRDGRSAEHAAEALVAMSKGRCPVCRTLSCACSSARYRDDPRTIVTVGGSEKGLPKRLYPNPSGRGMLKLNEPDARRLGLLEAEPEPKEDAEPMEHKKREEPKPGGATRRKKPAKKNAPAKPKAEEES